MKIVTKRRIVKTKKIGRSIIRGISRTSKIVVEKSKVSSKNIAVNTSSVVNAIIAPKEFARLIEQWFTRFNINKDIYDTAIDSVYNATRIGGPKLHHLLDGQHSLWGAFKAAKDASPNDTFFQEVTNATEHLTRDICSVSGINPFIHLTKEQYHNFASFSHIPKNWLADAFTFNAVEVIGASIATLALVFGWSKLDSKQFSEYAGALGVSAIVSANPLLGLVVVISAARAFTLEKRKEGFEKSKLQLVRCAVKGTVTPTIVIAMSYIIGGPVYVGLIFGIVVAVLVRKKMDNNKFEQGFNQFLEAFCLDFIKPKAHSLRSIVKNTYIKSYQKIKEVTGKKRNLLLVNVVF